MATINAAIAAGADDVALDGNGFDIANGYPVLGNDGTNCIYAFRVAVSGLAGATITAAYIDNVNQANGGAASPTLAIYAEDAQTPARITSLNDLNGRTRTTAKVDWDVAWTGYNTKDSPSIVSIIQELADSYDPTYIQIFIQNDGGAAGVQVYAYEGEYPPTLHIEYTPGSSGISGTVNAALGALTASSAGVVAIKGQVSKTLAAMTATSAGAVAIKGATAKTLGALTVSASGSVGTIVTTGTLNATLGALTVSASGKVAIAGQVSKTLGALISTSTGVLPIKGQVSATLGALTVTATGAQGNTNYGRVNSTLGALTANASGVVAIRGATNSTLGTLVGASTGTIAIRGASANTLGALTANAHGTSAITGQLNATLAALVVVATAAAVFPATGAGNRKTLRANARGSASAGGRTPITTGKRETIDIDTRRIRANEREEDNYGD